MRELVRLYKRIRRNHQWAGTYFLPGSVARVPRTLTTVQNTEACCSSLGGNENQRISLKPSIEEAQKIQENREKLLELSNFLEMNQEVMKLMKIGFERYRRIRQKNHAAGTTTEEAESEVVAFEEFNASLDEHSIRAFHHQKRALLLVKRCDGVISLVSLIDMMDIVYNCSHGIDHKLIGLTREHDHARHSEKGRTIFTINEDNNNSHHGVSPSNIYRCTSSNQLKVLSYISTIMG